MKLNFQIFLRYLFGTFHYFLLLHLNILLLKGKKGDFVSLVTLNTTPPQVSHGLGATLEEAHDNVTIF